MIYKQTLLFWGEVGVFLVEGYSCLHVLRAFHFVSGFPHDVRFPFIKGQSIDWLNSVTFLEGLFLVFYVILS